MAHFNLTNNTHVDIIHQLLDFDIPVLAVGGGGYNPADTARGWALAWAVFTGQDDRRDLSAKGSEQTPPDSGRWKKLRDPELIPEDSVRREVDIRVTEVVEKVKSTIFPFHGF